MGKINHVRRPRESDLNRLVEALSVRWKIIAVEKDLVPTASKRKRDRLSDVLLLVRV